MSKPVRAGTHALAWVATLTGAAGVGLHFSRSSAQPLALGASIAPYLMASAPIALAAWVVMRHWPPVIGIDHIVLADAHAVSVETVGLPGADHRALVARVRLPGIH